jgi:hypothetical protein
MPDLDVADVLLDPDFCEQITVIRRVQAVSTSGAAFASNTQNLIITGVVTIGSMLALKRASDYELANNVITVHSQTRLQGPTANGYPDIVVWKGNKYVVKRQSDWSHYGQGFTAAECELQDTTGET